MKRSRFFVSSEVKNKTYPFGYFNMKHFVINLNVNYSKDLFQHV